MLRRRPDEQLGPRAGRGGRYLMRHKLLALGDDYYIENALGQRSTLSMAKPYAQRYEDMAEQRNTLGGLTVSWRKRLNPEQAHSRSPGGWC
jgi:hypothetical protein